MQIVKKCTYYSLFLISAVVCASPVATKKDKPQNILPNTTKPTLISKLIKKAKSAEHTLKKRHPLLVSAGPSIWAPPGYAADWGVVFAGLSVVNRWPGTTLPDGNAVLGFGLGDGEKSIGVTVATLMDSLGYYNHSFNQNGNINAQAFRWLTPNTAVSVGAANPIGWGVFRHFSKSYYGSVTHLLPLVHRESYQLPLALTMGVGTGAFYSVAEFQGKRDGKVMPFTSAAFGVLPRTNIIVDYTMQILSAGISAIPPFVPAVMTVYASNLAGGHKYPGPVTYGIRIGVGYGFFL